MSDGAAPEHKNLTALAKALGFSTPALSGWRKRFPDDVPQSLREDEWRAFIARHNLGTVGNRVGKSREALLTEKLSTEVRLNRIKIAREERQLIDAKDVDSFLLYVGARMKSALYQMCSELPPKVAGLEAPEVRKLMREGCDVICVSMQSAHEDWRREQEEAAAAAAEAGPEPTEHE